MHLTRISHLSPASLEKNINQFLFPALGLRKEEKDSKNETAEA